MRNQLFRSRISLSLLAVFLQIVCVRDALCEAPHSIERPNILLLLADNWAWPHASIAGDPVVQTPRFDALAKQGILFSNAYCQVPSCSPARAVLLTGQASHRLKQAANLWGSWPHYLRTYPELLEDAGYFVGQEGKGWAPGMIAQSSSARRTRNPAGPKHKTFESFLDKKPDGQPFCYWFGSHNPHQPWRADKHYYEGLDASKLKIPAYLPDHPEIRQALLNYYAEVQAFDAEIGELLDTLDRRGLADNTLVVVMGDNGWQTPRGLANVYDAGTRTPMVICWPGTIKPGGQSDAFVSFEDLAPTFLVAAGLDVPDAMTGKSMLPLLTGESTPTWSAVFLERERHANVRAGNATYPCRAIRNKEFLYVWNLAPDRWPAGDPKMHFAVGPYGDVDNTPFKTIVLEGQNDRNSNYFFELGFSKRLEHELYHLRSDPDQVKNLASEERYTKVVKELNQRVRDWMKKTKDPRYGVPNTPVFDQYQYYGGPPSPKRIAPAKAYKPND